MTGVPARHRRATMDKTCDIHIKVVTDYLGEQSEPESDRYVFAYTITISNHGNVAARLLSRHWLITDANGKLLSLTIQTQVVL